MSPNSLRMNNETSVITVNDNDFLQNTTDTQTCINESCKSEI